MAVEMDLADFHAADFSPTCDDLAACEGGFVYILSWVDAGGVEAPFYVGETGRLRGRMRDYSLAQFKASTDFRVGEAIKYIANEKGCRVRVKYKASEDRGAEEARTIRKLHLSGYQLLNDFVGYDYKVADVEAERFDIRRFVDILSARNGK